MSSEIAIKVENLSKSYQIYDQPYDRLKQFILPRLQGMVGLPAKKYFREFWALKDISFELKKGEIVGIIGRNGSGKSTLLQIICGTLNSTCGEIQAKGRIAALLELGSGFNPEFTGRENVYMNAALLGLDSREIDACFNKIAEFADIGDFMDQPLKTYSSGMQVRLAFAVSVSINPDIFIVDEALAVGDMAFQQKCLQRLEDLKHDGVTILLVTHDIFLTRNYCSKLIYLESGEIKEIGNPEIIGEMYIKDLLSKDSSQKIAFQLDHNNGKIKLSTDIGRIVEVKILSKEEGTPFLSGETISIMISGVFKGKLKNPQIVIQIRDYRGYVVYGISTSPIDLQIKKTNEMTQVLAQLKIPLHLAPGFYAIAVSLNDRLGQSVFALIDKIVSAIEFQIDDARYENIHGCINLYANWVTSQSGIAVE